jgi:hypothetical protein
MYTILTAISTVVHTTIGAALAAYWRKNPVTDTEVAAKK